MTKQVTEKVVKSIRLTFQEFNTEGSRRPSKFFIRDGLGDYVFVCVKTRKEAQQWINDTYGTVGGKSRYTVRAEGEEGGNSATARCSLNSASRKGNNFLKMKSNFGAGER